MSRSRNEWVLAFYLLRLDGHIIAALLAPGSFLSSAPTPFANENISSTINHNNNEFSLIKGKSI